MSFNKLMILFSLFNAAYSGSYIFSQDDNKISIFANPLIFRIGDVHSQYTSVESIHINSNYNNSPSNEAGIKLQSYRSSVQWLIGASLLLRKHAYSFETVNSLGMSSIFRDVRLKQHYLGLLAGGIFCLNDKFNLNYSLNIYLPFKINSNLDSETLNLGKSIDSSHYRAVTIEHRRTKMFIIPDLSISCNLYKNVWFNIGARIKFWTSDIDWILRTDVTDITVTNNNDINTNQIYYSAIKDQGIYTYIGLTLNLPPIKRRKERVSSLD
jgi:hypothetical protein